MKRKHIDILELKTGMCRWPFGNGPFTFCARPQKDGSSYCEAHHAKAYTRVPEKKKFTGGKSSITFGGVIIAKMGEGDRE